MQSVRTAGFTLPREPPWASRRGQAGREHCSVSVLWVLWSAPTSKPMWDRVIPHVTMNQLSRATRQPTPGR